MTCDTRVHWWYVYIFVHASWSVHVIMYASCLREKIWLTFHAPVSKLHKQTWSTMILFKLTLVLRRTLEGPTYASPYYYFLREEKNSSNNSQTLKRSRTKSPYWAQEWRRTAGHQPSLTYTVLWFLRCTLHFNCQYSVFNSYLWSRNCGSFALIVRALILRKHRIMYQDACVFSCVSSIQWEKQWG